MPCDPLVQSGRGRNCYVRECIGSMATVIPLCEQMNEPPEDVVTQLLYMSWQLALLVVTIVHDHIVLLSMIPDDLVHSNKVNHSFEHASLVFVLVLNYIIFI